MRKLLCSAILALAMAGPAAAADVAVAKAPTASVTSSPWTGVYVGFGGGATAGAYGLSAHSVVPGYPASAGLDGFGAQGALFGINLGLDYQIAPQYVVGAFFDYDWHNSKVTASANIFDGAITAAAKAQEKAQWSLGARVGYLPAPSTLWYVSGGYTQIDIGDLTGSAAVDGNLIGTAKVTIPSFGGWFVGIGAETLLAKNWSLKAEYRYSSFGSKNLGLPYGLGEYAAVGLEPQVQTFKASLNYRFNTW